MIPQGYAPRLTCLRLLVTASLLVTGGRSCDLDACTTSYVMGKESQQLDESPSWHFCHLLQKYHNCTSALGTACRTDIQYFSIRSMQITLMNRHGCRRILEGPSPEPLASLPPTTLVPDPRCVYNGDPATPPVHCGLFGDPHLRTFHGTYMTCGVRGAWPLLNTPHLAIQVTNQQVTPAHHATATTKVTVIIKSHDAGVCGEERTYEASSEALPKAFVDGTTWSGGSLAHPAVAVSEAVSGEHVIITILPINTTVALRKFDKYLTVVVTLPAATVNATASGDDELQLCVQGCPSAERLDLPGSPVTQVMPAMHRRKAADLCLEHNLTDYYLDSCIFDLMTTGDTSFRVAAAAALHDLWNHAPVAAHSLLQNCTAHPCVWQLDDTASKATPSSYFTHVFLLGALLAAMTHHASYVC